MRRELIKQQEKLERERRRDEEERLKETDRVEKEKLRLMVRATRGLGWCEANFIRGQRRRSCDSW